MSSALTFVSCSVTHCPPYSHFDYITPRRQGHVFVRKSHTVSTYPEDIKSKVYLLKYFERYIMGRLYNETDYTYEDTDRKRGMVFVQKFLRMKHVIIFKMSHDVIQVSLPSFFVGWMIFVLT